ncbi:MAG: alpha/beta fold hydrolase [Vicinamibacteria bacterium]
MGSLRVGSEVPAELVARLERFREANPYRTHRLAGNDWRFIDAGRGEPALLVLSGAACVAEMSWTTIEHCARARRVIAPDYPAIRGNAELVDGVAALLEREGIERAHVFGGSYGGMLAQVFVRRHPGRSLSLLLSHTLLPDPRSASRVRWTAGALGLLPWRVVRALFKARLGGLFPETTNPELALAKALFEEILEERLSKPQLLALLHRVGELGQARPFAPDDLAAWPGRILLLIGEDDPATPEPARRALAAAYPRAEVRIFSGGGHATAILKQAEYFAAIDAFLAA